VRYQRSVDIRAAEALDRLEARNQVADVRDIIAAIVRPLVETLDTQSGRDCVRIIPQLLPELSRNLRAGVAYPTTPVSRRILTMLDERMTTLSVPEPIRRERLVVYAVVFTTLLGERAHQIEAGGELLLSGEQFAAHLVHTLEAVLLAASTVKTRRTT
jgi:hypothetical protein